MVATAVAIPSAATAATTVFLIELPMGKILPLIGQVGRVLRRKTMP
jgi:hypothetical protein